MRTLRLLWIVVLVAALAACDESSALDEPHFQSSLPLPGTTQPPLTTATPVVTVPATRPAQFTPQPTITAFPTMNPDDMTDQPVDNVIWPGEWLTQPFTDENGDSHTLTDYAGRAVIVQLVSTTCDMCAEQHHNLINAIRERYDMGQLSDTVFIVMDVDTQDNTSLIRSMLQRQLGEDWNMVDILRQPDTPADYFIAYPTPGLLALLERDFHPQIGHPDSSMIIVIQSDGPGHLMNEGLVSEKRLSDVISFYSNPALPTDLPPMPTPNL